MKIRIKKQIPWMIIFGVLSFIVGLLSILPMQFIQKSIDNLMNANNINKFIFYILLYLLMHILAEIAHSKLLYFAGKIERREILNQRINLTEKVLNSYVDVFEKYGKDKFFRESKDDFEKLSTIYTDFIISIASSFATFLFGMIILISYDILIALIILPLSFIATVIVKFTYKQFDLYTKDNQKAKSIFESWYQKVFDGMREIILYKKEGFFKYNLKDSKEAIEKSEQKTDKMNYMSNASISISFNIVIGALILIGGFRIEKNFLSIGELVAVIMYNSMITDPIYQLIDRQKDIFKLKNAYERLKTSERELEERKILKLEELESIELKDVSLKYHDKNVLNHFNLKINKGDIVRLCGKTGIGKTSIVKLLTKLYRPTDGKILINDKENVTVNMSTVFQSNSLFDTSIEENIVFFGQMDRNKYQKILKITHTDEIVQKYKDELIGEDGNKLSGGERTRVLIARALYKDSDFYIFDEISTGLNEDLFDDIFKELLKYLNGKTMVFIDHKQIESKYFTKMIYL
ncbi:MAG: ABC transporter ATP-binding protein [Tissierellia bacterium]|nr:ABC transporter ATP-binding protein [Tissierellia bacterium]